MQQRQALPNDLSGHVEVTALPNVYSVVAAANLPALQAALQFSDVWQETAILQRLFYKNKNQHRSSKHHQAIGQVLRALQLLDQLQLPQLLIELHAAAQRTSVPEATTAAAAAAPHRNSKRYQQQPLSVDEATDSSAPSTKRQIVRLPSFQAGCFVLRRLLASCQISLTCNNAILTAAEHMSGQLSRGYFMPFCLVAVASLARLRVLMMDGLMQQMQAYHSIMRLLPLLPVQANIASQPTAAAAMVTSHTKRTARPLPGAELNSRSSSSSSSSSAQYLGVDIHGLPDLLKLTWQGPIPALQCIPFDKGDNITTRAAQLHETFCISWPTATAAAGAVRDGGLVAVPTAERLGSSTLAAAAAAGNMEGEVGQSIGREEYDRLLLSRQQQQQQVPHSLLIEDRHAEVTIMLPDSKAVQQRQQQVPQIMVFEDRHAAQSNAELNAQDLQTIQRQQQQQARVPMYSTAPGLGMGLGTGLGQQQQQQQVPIPGLDLQQPPAAVAAAAAGVLSHSAAEEVGLQGGTSTHHHQQQQQAMPPGLALAPPTAAAGQPAAAGTVPMDSSSLGPEDQSEYEDLYGSDVPPRHHTAAAAAAVGVHAALPEQQQQQQQQQARPAGAVAVKHQRLGTGAAAALAMQGYGSSSSSSDDDMDVALAVPTLPVNAGAAAAGGGAATAAAASASQDVVLQELLQPQQQQQQRQQLGVHQNPPAAVFTQQTLQRSAVEIPTVTVAAATPPVSAAAVNAGVKAGAAVGSRLAVVGSNLPAAVAPHGLESPAVQQQQQQQQQQIQQQQTQDMMDVDDASATATAAAAAGRIAQLEHVSPPPAAAAAAAKAEAEALTAEAQATPLLGYQTLSAPAPAPAEAAAAGCVSSLRVSRRASKREAARQQQQQQQQSQPEHRDWVMQLLTSDPAPAPAAAAMRSTGAAGSDPAVAAGTNPAAAARGDMPRTMRHNRKTVASQQINQSTRGGSADPKDGESTSARDPILDMLLEGL